MLLDEAGRGLRKWCFIEEIDKGLFWLIDCRMFATFALLLLLIQINLLWFHFKKGRMLLLWLVLAIVLIFLLCLIMESNRAFGDVASGALLRTRLA